MNRTRRTILAGAGGAAMAAVLGACAGPGGQAGAGDPRLQPSKTPVTLTAFLGLTDPQAQRFATDIAAPFHQQFPNVTLQVTPQPSAGGMQGVMEKLTSLIAAGSPPDIFEGSRYAYVVVEQGFIETTMDALVKRDKYKIDAYNPKEFAIRATYQGKVVQMPWKLGGNSLLILCNTDLFQAAGVPLPAADVSKAWTWDEWLQAAVKLTKRNGDDVTQFGHENLGWTIGSWPLLWQTDWLSSDLKSVTCDTADMVDCYSKLYDLHYKQRVVPLPGQTQAQFGNANLFNTGKTAMRLIAVGSWPTFVTPNPAVPIYAAPIPKVKISTPDVSTQSLSIVKGAKAHGDAWEAIKYMIEDARLPRLAERMPARLDHLEPFIKDSAKASPKIESKLVLDVARNFVPQSNITRHLNQDPMLNVINPQLDDLWANKIAPGPMLKAIKPQLENLLQTK